MYDEIMQWNREFNGVDGDAMYVLPKFGCHSIIFCCVVLTSFVLCSSVITSRSVLNEAPVHHNINTVPTASRHALPEEQEPAEEDGL